MVDGGLGLMVRGGPVGKKGFEHNNLAIFELKLH